MTSKWMETMEKKLGSKEALSEYMSQLAKKKKGQKSPNSGVASLTAAEKSKRGREAANKRWNKK